MPGFPPGWAKITFDDRESLRLPLDPRLPLGDELGGCAAPAVEWKALQMGAAVGRLGRGARR
jgi:hypothetical protein